MSVIICAPIERLAGWWLQLHASNDPVMCWCTRAAKHYSGQKLASWLLESLEQISLPVVLAGHERQSWLELIGHL